MNSMITTDQIINGVTKYVFNVHILLVCIFVLGSFFSYLKKRSYIQLFRFDNTLIRLLKLLYTSMFNLYKVIILFLHFLLGIPLLINYIFNLLAIRNLSKGHAKSDQIKMLAKNPFKQYEAMFYLIEADSERVQVRYHNFSMGFWLLLPLFLTGATLIGNLFGMILVLLWPTLTILQLLYADNAPITSNKLKHYLPLLIQLLSINLLGSFLLYLKSRGKKN